MKFRQIITILIIAVFLVVAIFFQTVKNLEIVSYISIIISIVASVVTILKEFYSSPSTSASEKVETVRSQKSRGLFYRFEPDYFRMLQYQNRDFDIKGLSTQTVHSLELEQVFVDLSLKPQAIHKAAIGPVQNEPSDIRSGTYSLWKMLKFLEREEKGPKLVVIGPPGSGKTTLMRHITMVLTTPVYRRSDIANNNRLPILLFLRDHAQNIVENPNLRMPDLVELTLKRVDLRPPENWFESKLKKGKFLIMLDGLDEVADIQARRLIVSWVERQTEIYPDNVFIVTSRPYGYREASLAGVNVFEVMPFSREKIDYFVHNWYLANEIKSHLKNDDGVRQQAKAGAQDLLNRLGKSADLMALAVNPLLLTMIATVHRYRSALPGRRVELYKEIFEVFLGKRQQSKGLDVNLTPAQQQSVLQPLAYQMMSDQQREIRLENALELIKQPLLLVQSNVDARTFIKNIENQSGLLLERENGIYAFAHKTFQEYLASVHALQQKLESELTTHVENEWWHETIRLYTAQTDASGIITACLDIEPPQATALSLAIQCIEEAHQIRPNVREILKVVLMRDVEDKDPMIRRVIADALLASRVRSLAPISPEKLIDTKLLTNAEYQLFVDDELKRDFQHFPSQWKDVTFPPGTANNAVLGMTYQDAEEFCTWLSDRNRGAGWKYRLPILAELEDQIYNQYQAIWVKDSGGKLRKWEKAWPKLSTRQIDKLVKEDIGQILKIIQNKDGKISDISTRVETINMAINKIANKPDNLNQQLITCAKELYSFILEQDLERGIDFANETKSDFLEYDPAVSLALDRAKNIHMERGVVDAIQNFQTVLIKIGPRTNRLLVLYLALSFKFFSAVTPNLLRLSYDGAFNARMSCMVDVYLDLVVLEARKYGVVDPIEGIIFVKESVQTVDDY
jgi:hypothetical protein